MQFKIQLETQYLSKVLQYLHQRTDILNFYSINEKTRSTFSKQNFHPYIINDFTSFMDYYIFVTEFFPSAQTLTAPYNVIKTLMSNECSHFRYLSVSDWKQHYQSIDLSKDTMLRLFDYVGLFENLKTLCPSLKRMTLIKIKIDTLKELIASIKNYPQLQFMRLYLHSSIFKSIYQSNDSNEQKEDNQQSEKEEKKIVNKKILHEIISYLNQIYNSIEQPFKLVIDVGLLKENKKEFMKELYASNSNIIIMYNNHLSKYEEPYNYKINPYYQNYFNKFTYSHELLFDGQFHEYNEELQSLTNPEHFLKQYYPQHIYSNATNPDYRWLTTVTKLSMDKRVSNLKLPTSLKTLKINEDFLYWSYKFDGIYFNCKIENEEELQIQRMETVTLNSDMTLPSTLISLNVENVEDDFICPSQLTQLRIGDVPKKINVVLNNGLQELFISKVPTYLQSSLKYLYTPMLNVKITIPIETIELENMKKAECSKLPIELKNLTINSCPSFELNHLTNLTRLHATIIITNSVIKMDRFSVPSSLQLCSLRIGGNISKNKHKSTLDSFKQLIAHVPQAKVRADYEFEYDKKVKKYLLNDSWN